MLDALSNIWWLWIAVALGLGLIELFAPGFIFLGFALGALATGVVVAVSDVSSTPLLLAIFAGLSLLSWVALRVAFKKQSSGARIVESDIND